MYFWILCEYYNYLKLKNNSDPLFNAVGIIFITQVIHFGLIAIIIRNFFNINLFVLEIDNINNKLAFFPVGIVWLVFTYFYYKRRINKHKFEYQNSVYFFKPLLIFIVTALIPLYIAINLSGGEIWQ
jgi:hypothetical protein